MVKFTAGQRLGTFIRCLCVSDHRVPVPTAGLGRSIINVLLPVSCFNYWSQLRSVVKASPHDVSTIGSG